MGGVVCLWSGGIYWEVGQRLCKRNHVKISPALPTDKELRTAAPNAHIETCAAAGRRAATAPSSLCGNPLRTMRSCDDLSAVRRLLVRGIAARPDAGRRRR